MRLLNGARVWHPQGTAPRRLRYRWTFNDTYLVTSMDDPDLNFLQTYKLEAITEPRYLHDVEAARALLEKTCVPAR